MRSINSNQFDESILANEKKLKNKNFETKIRINS